MTERPQQMRSIGLLTSIRQAINARPWLLAMGGLGFFLLRYGMLGYVLAGGVFLATVLLTALAITDLTSRSGYDSMSAIRQVREVRLRTGAPVLVLTAHREAQRDGVLAAEASAVMTKPFQLDELLATVQRLAV